MLLAGIIYVYIYIILDYQLEYEIISYEKTFRVHSVKCLLDVSENTWVFHEKKKDPSLQRCCSELWQSVCFFHHTLCQASDISVLV